MKFVDLHFHGLYGLDDGAKTLETAQSMLDAAYSDGTRAICFTPHFHPGYYGHNGGAAMDRYLELRHIAGERWPELELYLGNELHYDPACVGWLDSGECRTIHETRYLLVDFSDDVPEYTLVKALKQLLGIGYRPILAHIERYSKLRGKTGTIRDLADSGIVIQVDSQGVLGGFGMGARHAARHLLRCGLVDLVASDAHDTEKRPPELSKCYHFVEEHWGRSYADVLFWENPRRILKGDDVWKE